VLYELVVWAADAPSAPAEPGLPYEQIGLVLVALVTGITTIVVTLIQKGNKAAGLSPSLSTSGSPFVIGLSALRPH
jgi:hypothetical protein